MVQDNSKVPDSADSPMPEQGAHITYGTRFEPRPDSGASVTGIMTRLLDDMWMSRPSVLLLIVFWPFAFFCMIVAQIKRILLVGSVRTNVAFAVSSDARVMNPILALSATEIGRRIKLPKAHPDKLRSSEVVEIFIYQIRLTNVYVLAVVAARFEEARREAAAADAAVDDGSAPDEPFWGVPVVVKECFEMPGMPYSGGM